MLVPRITWLSLFWNKYIKEIKVSLSMSVMPSSHNAMQWLRHMPRTNGMLGADVLHVELEASLEIFGVIVVHQTVPAASTVHQVKFFCAGKPGECLFYTWSCCPFTFWSGSYSKRSRWQSKAIILIQCECPSFSCSQLQNDDVTAMFRGHLRPSVRPLKNRRLLNQCCHILNSLLNICVF